ncbi:transmembrane protease serine 9-like [Nematostella vectensis]|uniref:transmembrane protease serine 9-like n=1 Tax=Nematostella vectensis TaxID=45351 RepID=UPI001390601A|nr:transmembrane protease serine 9-like [Nematostella vectensis]
MASSAGFQWKSGVRWNTYQQGMGGDSSTLFSRDPGMWSVTLEEHHLREKEGFEQIIGVDKIIIHQQNNLDLLLQLMTIATTPPDYDLALLKLSKSAKLNRNVHPICLLPPSKKLPWGRRCYISGWCATEYEGPKPETIREATEQLVPPEICNQVESYNGTIHSRALCAGFDQGGVDACQFDSAGPLSCSIGSRF